MVTASLHLDEARTADEWAYERCILPHIDRCYDMFGRELGAGGGVLGSETRKLAYHLARAYTNLGDMRKSNSLYETALRGVEMSTQLDDVYIMDSLGMNLRLQAKYADSLRWFTQARDAVWRKPELEHMALKVVQHIATTLTDQGNYDEALQKLIWVLERQEEMLGEDHLSALETRYHIALVLRNKGSLKEALKELERVHDTRKERLDADHPSTLEAAHAIAMVFEKLGRYDKALESHMEVLESRMKCLGATHYSTLDTMDSIASVYERQGRYDDALKMYKKVLKLLEGIFGNEPHPWPLATRSGIADVLMRQAKYQAAEKEYKQVYNGFKILGNMVKGALPTQTNIARVQRDVGKYREALNCCETALQGLERNNLDEDHVYVLAAKLCKASIYELQGRYEEALELYHQVRKGREKVSEDHPEALRARCFIASVTAKLGRYEEALNLYSVVEERLQVAVGPNHPFILMAVLGKGDILEELGQHDEAFEHYQRVYGTRQEIHNNQQPEAILALYGIAKVRVGKRDFEGGIECFKDAIKKWKDLFKSDNHPLIYKGLEDLGNAYMEIGKAKEAETFCRQALKGCREILGDEHPQTYKAQASFSAKVVETELLKR